MILLQKIVIKALIVLLFVNTANKIHAQRMLTAQEYVDSVYILAEELKVKLEKIQHANSRISDMGSAVHYALEDLKNVKFFYLEPHKLSLDWTVHRTYDLSHELIDVRPYKETNNRYNKSYIEQSLKNVIYKESKGIYVFGNQPYLSPLEYDETTSISFYDPSGRQIECWGKLLEFESLRDLIKSSKLQVMHTRGSRPFLDMTGSSPNRGIGATYEDVPSSWLLQSCYTNEIVQLPFGTFWTRTPEDGGYKCITVDVMAAHDYKESILGKSDKAIRLYGFDIEYAQLLQWYKESLDYLMRHVNRHLKEQERQNEIKENAFNEADKREPLGMLLVETAAKIKADKKLFDFVIIENGTSYEIKVVANKNTAKFTKDFWDNLYKLKDAKGNISLYYLAGGSRYNYNVAKDIKDNKLHITKLLNDISDVSKSNVEEVLKTVFRWNNAVIYDFTCPNEFRIYGLDNRTDYDRGILIPCLESPISKDHVIYSLTINKNDATLRSNVKNGDYNIKIKK